MASALLALLGALIAALLWFGFRPIMRWKLRKIPGPLAPPFVGNLPAIASMGIHRYAAETSRRYGPVAVAFNGTRPWVIISDADLGRRALFRCGRCGRPEAASRLASSLHDKLHPFAGSSTARASPRCCAARTTR